MKIKIEKGTELSDGEVEEEEVPYSAPSLKTDIKYDPRSNFQKENRRERDNFGTNPRSLYDRNNRNQQSKPSNDYAAAVRESNFYHRGQQSQQRLDQQSTHQKVKLEKSTVHESNEQRDASRSTILNQKSNANITPYSNISSSIIGAPDNAMQILSMSKETVAPSASSALNRSTEGVSSAIGNAPIDDDVVDDDDMEDYNWGGDDCEYIKRQLINFMLLDEHTRQPCSLLSLIKNPGKRLILRGDLIPAPGATSMRKRSHEAVVDDYIVDLGMPQSIRKKLHFDTNENGLWFKEADDDDIWYRLNSPCHINYEEFDGSNMFEDHDIAINPYLHPYFKNFQCLELTDFAVTDILLGFSKSIIRELSDGGILNNSVIDPRKKYMTLTGILISKSPSTNPMLKVRTYISDQYYLDFGLPSIIQQQRQHEEEDDDDEMNNNKSHYNITIDANTVQAQDAPDPQFWVKDCYGIWIHLSGSCHEQYRYCYNEIMGKVVNNVHDYDWNTEESSSLNQIWRRIDDFFLTDFYGEMKDLEIIPSETLPTHILSGIMLPSPNNSHAPKINIKLYIKMYSIDTGESDNDPNRGLWMIDIYNNFYKLQNPLQRYQNYAKSLFYKTNEFLKFFNALIFYDVIELTTFNKKLQRYICPYTIKKVYKLSNKMFSLEFIAKNTTFIFANMDQTVSFIDSPEFLDSIFDLEEYYTKLSTTSTTSAVEMNDSIVNDTSMSQSISIIKDNFQDDITSRPKSNHASSILEQEKKAQGNLNRRRAMPLEDTIPDRAGPTNTASAVHQQEKRVKRYLSTKNKVSVKVHTIEKRNFENNQNDVQDVDVDLSHLGSSSNNPASYKPIAKRPRIEEDSPEGAVQKKRSHIPAGSYEDIISISVGNKDKHQHDTSRSIKIEKKSNAVVPMKVEMSEKNRSNAASYSTKQSQDRIEVSQRRHGGHGPSYGDHGGNSRNTGNEHDNRRADLNGDRDSHRKADMDRRRDAAESSKSQGDFNRDTSSRNRDRSTETLHPKNNTVREDGLQLRSFGPRLDNLRTNFVQLLKESSCSMDYETLRKRYRNKFNTLIQLADENGLQFTLKEIILSHPNIRMKLAEDDRVHFYYSNSGSRTVSRDRYEPQDMNSSSHTERTSSSTGPILKPTVDPTYRRHDYDIERKQYLRRSVSNATAANRMPVNSNVTGSMTDRIVNRTYPDRVIPIPSANMKPKKSILKQQPDGFDPKRKSKDSGRRKIRFADEFKGGHNEKVKVYDPNEA